MMRINLKGIWQGIRSLSGVNAYERYLVHWYHHHGESNSAPLDRKTFYEQQLQRKWNGVNRCC